MPGAPLSIKFGQPYAANTGMENSEQPLPDRTLLLVDDEQYILNSLKRALRHDGYRIETALSGEEGLRLAAAMPIQVVVADQRMPGMSGTEFLRRLKQRFPDTVRIVLSGYTEIESVTQAVNEGAIYKFLTKPWEDHELRAAIQEAFAHYSLKIENLRLTEELTAANQQLTHLNREIHRSFQALFEGSKDAILILDESGLINFANPSAMDLVGGGSEGLIGRSLDLTNLQGAAEVQLSRPGDTPLYAQLQTARIHHEGRPAYLVTLHDTTQLYRMEQERQHNQRLLQSALLQTIEAVALTVEKRDPYTSGHQSRVTDLAIALGQMLNLPESQLEGIRLGALIHDLGKIYIPAEILNRPGHLSDVEFTIVKSHSQVGFDILRRIDFPWPVATMILQHHERLDGSGYPQGLRGDQVITEARIIAVADVVESMLSHRPYRPAIPVREVMEHLEQESGVKLDASVVDACRRLFMERGYQLPEAGADIFPPAPNPAVTQSHEPRPLVIHEP
jgi:putative nucleotidyltransferase with HDIG domain